LIQIKEPKPSRRARPQLILAHGALILWKQITAEPNGHTVTGLYSTLLGLVTVMTPYDSKSRQLGGSSTTLIARILLRELAAEGKA
jgi:hypothetical protein